MKENTINITNLFKFNYMENIKNFIIFVFTTVIGYLSPISSIVHVVLLFFLIDILYGWLADRKINNAKFQPKIVWEKTVPRIVLTIIALILAFILDEVTNQKWVTTYNLVGWSICSLLFLSIIRNGYIVTNWSVLKSIFYISKNKIEKETGINVNEKISNK